MTTEKLPLHLNDLFWTFQGEGYHAGRRALFVRMPFCNLACTWCDTTFNTFHKVPEEEFLAVARAEPTRFAVITGGEPMLNKHTPRMVDLLRGLGFEVACETNGTAPIVPGVDFPTVSPKRFSGSEKNPKSPQQMPPYFVCEDAFLRAAEFKYVVDKAFDFSILDRHELGPDQVNPCARLSLSPEFSDLKGNLARIFEYVTQNPRWRISLQTHKWMEVK